MVKPCIKQQSMATINDSKFDAPVIQVLDCVKFTSNEWLNFRLQTKRESRSSQKSDTTLLMQCLIKTSWLFINFINYDSLHNQPKTVTVDILLLSWNDRQHGLGSSHYQPNTVLKWLTSCIPTRLELTINWSNLHTLTFSKVILFIMITSKGNSCLSVMQITAQSFNCQAWKSSINSSTIVGPSFLVACFVQILL